MSVLVSFVPQTQIASWNTGRKTVPAISLPQRRSFATPTTPFMRTNQLKKASSSSTSAPESIRTANVVVVGGGPCGALAAIKLHQRGIPVTLVEKVPDFTKFDVSRSYILTLDFRGRKVLDSVPGLLDRVKNEGLVFERMKITAWTAEDEVKTFTSASKTPDGEENVRVLRPGLLIGLKTFVLNYCDNVTPMYGTSLKSIRFEEDGNMELLLDTKGKQHYLRTRLILACDGKNSVVLKELERGARDEGTVTIKNSHGFGDIPYDSPAVGLKVKSIVLNETVTTDIERKNPEAASQSDDVKFLRGQMKERPVTAKFNTVMFPLRPKYLKMSGVILGAIVARADHSLWKLENVEDGYKLFEANHPQANIRDYISPEEMQRFVSARPLTFPPISRPKSLVHHIGSSSLGGVACLGDAAHSFPPDLGQGANAAFLDVGTLMQVFGEARDNEQIRSVLQRYEGLVDGEASALMSLHRVAAPYQYGQSTAGSQLTLINSALRRKLENVLPGVFYAAMKELVFRDLSYSEIVRQAEVTTTRLRFIAISVLLVPLIGILSFRVSF